jgi:hypothetical protein
LIEVFADVPDVMYGVGLGALMAAIPIMAMVVFYKVIVRVV